MADKRESFSVRFTVDDAKKRVRQDPNSFENQGVLGELLYRSGRFEEAIEPLKKAAELLQTRIESLPQGRSSGYIGSFPREMIARMHHDMYLMCGDCLTKLGRYEEASDVVKKGVGMIDDDSDGWNMLGVAQANSGDIDGALRSFREAVRRNPARRDLWENLQECYRSLSRPEAEEIAVVLDRKRDLEDDMVLLVDFFIGGGEYDKAKSVIGQLVKWNSKDKRVLLPMSRLHIIDGEYEEARKRLQELLKTDKDNIEALWQLARVFAILGRKNDSLKHLEIVLKLDANHSNAHELSKILQHHGDETRLTFGVFIHEAKDPSADDDRTIHEYKVRPELTLPIGSTLEDAMHFLVKGEFFRFTKEQSMKYALLMIFQGSGSLRYSCDALPAPVPDEPLFCHEYIGCEPNAYRVNMHEPKSDQSSLSAVIAPNAMYSFLKTTLHPLQAAVVLSMYSMFKTTIDEQVASSSWEY